MMDHAVLAALCLVLLFIIIPKVKYLFESHPCLWSKRNMTWVQCIMFMGVRDFAEFWFDYEVHGLEKLRSNGTNCLLVGYHSRCTIDLFCVLCFVQPSVIATYVAFKVPVLGWFLREINVIPSGSGEKSEQRFVQELAASERPVMLLPGGAYECMKPLSMIGKIQWKDVPGFARIVHREQEVLGAKTKIIPFYTKNCERILYRSDAMFEYSGKFSLFLYKYFKHGHIYLLPLMVTSILISVGFKLLPRPVKLDTYLGEPVVLKEGETVLDFSQRIAAATQQLIVDVEAMPQRDTKMMSVLKQKTVDANVLKMYLTVGVLGTYCVLQNIFTMILLIMLIWAPVVVLFYAHRLYYAV